MLSIDLPDRKIHEEDLSEEVTRGFVGGYSAGKRGQTRDCQHKAERDRWARQLEPYKEKQFSSFGELGQMVKKITININKKYPYVPDKGIL